MIAFLKGVAPIMAVEIGRRPYPDTYDLPSRPTKKHAAARRTPLRRLPPPRDKAAFMPNPPIIIIKKKAATAATTAAHGKSPTPTLSPP